MNLLGFQTEGGAEGLQVQPPNSRPLRKMGGGHGQGS